MSEGPRRRYTKRQKAELVGRAEVEGVRPTARAARVPVSTLESWRTRSEFAQMRTEKREEVIADLYAVFQQGVRRIADLLPVTDDMSKVAIATGIIYDKFALMSGQVTARTELLNPTEGMNDGEKQALSDAIDEWLKAKA